MAHLIIGHVTATTARVWVRGTSKSKLARLSHRKVGTTAWRREERALHKHRGYIEVVELEGLEPATDYECVLTYKVGAAPPVNQGGFTTAPSGVADIRFFLGSCSIARGFITVVKNPKKAWDGVVKLVEREKPAFMIHCGDQIYADLPGKPPEFMNLRHYRDVYEKEWKVKGTRQVFANLPNYMILDDHEIFDNFYVDKKYVGAPSGPIRDAAMIAYVEYQHSHNPQTYPWPANYYTFDWGAAAFMVLDVRTERYKGDQSQMIGVVQMDELKKWLQARRGDVKFIVTSVPFVGEIRSGDDSWSGESFRSQREEIIDYLAEEDIGRLVFLTGDQHRSYHATMKITGSNGDIFVHELMSSPINQVTGGIGAFVTNAQFETAVGKHPYAIELAPEEFYGEHSNIMKIAVAQAGRVSWSIYRTKKAQDPVLSGEFSV